MIPHTFFSKQRTCLDSEASPGKHPVPFEHSLIQLTRNVNNEYLH